MFHKKNNGSALLRESDTNFNNFPLGLSVLIVDHDQQSLQEMEANLRRFGYEEMDLPVIVTSEDGKPDIVQRSLNYGAWDYLLKTIPMSVLKMVWKYMFLKKVTDNVSRVRNQRMSWTSDSHEKFVESVQKLGGIEKATPKKILQFLQSNFKGFEDVDREKIASHRQKYRDSLKKKAQLHMLGYKDKDGTSSEHIQSRYQMEEHPPMTLVDQVLKTTVANEPDILSQQQQAPAAKNTQGFQSVLPFETNLPTIGGSTSCGNQSNALMTQMDPFTGGQPFDYESFFNDVAELPSLDTFQGGISGGPGFYYNNIASLLGPFRTDHGEHGCSPGWNS